MLQLVRGIQEIVGISLRSELSALRFLDKVLVPLLLGKTDGVLLGPEVDPGALHEIGRGLPAHQRVLPPMTLGKDIPVHAPVVTLPLAGLGGGFGFLVDAGEETQNVESAG